MEIEINCSQDSFQNSVSLECIPTVTTEISYSYFFENFLMKNQPCIIRDIGNNWESTKRWVHNNIPNFSYLKSTYGGSDVTVYDCQQKYYNSQKTRSCSFNDFLQYWETYIKNGYPQSMPLDYLKDWHLKNEKPKDNFYEVPIYFASDWINEYFVDHSLDDYRFVYMGAKGTWTPFHADVLRSYSWSVNICGRKKWILFQPGEENYLCDHQFNFPYDVNDCNLQDRTYFEVTQNPNDAIFVPSGWHHQVTNLEDTISINHNWINGTNLKQMWLSLDKTLTDVKFEIKDCLEMDDFLDHCQIMLEATYGLNFITFYEFVKYIALKRIKFVKELEPITLQYNYVLGKKHALFDLLCIKNTLELFTQHDDLSALTKLRDCDLTPETLLNNIKTLLLQKKFILQLPSS